MSAFYLRAALGPCVDDLHAIGAINELFVNVHRLLVGEAERQSTKNNFCVTKS
jgi:hypothetical protein